MHSALEIIGLIYDAVAEPPLWQTVLDTFIQATNGIGGSLFVGDAKMDEYGFVCRHRMSEAEAALYHERYAATDGWALRTSAMPEGYVGASHDLWPEAEMLQSPAYQTCSGTLTGGTGSCMLTLTSPGSPKLTATYGGDSNFKSSTSAKVTQTVQQ